MPNEIYHKSNWGNANAEGFGDVYFDAAATNKLYNHSDYYENSDGTDKILRDLSNKASIVLTPTAYSDGSLNTVIPPYQVLPTELVTNGTFDTDLSGWQIKNSDATHTVTHTSDGARFQSDTTTPIMFFETIDIILQGGKKYSLTVEIVNRNSGELKIQGNNINLFYTDNGVFTDVIEPTGNARISFYRNTSNVDITIKSVSVKEIQEADFDFSRGSSATRVNEQGLIESIASNLPRIDYTSGFGSLKFEPQRTNLIDYSEDLTQWTSSSGIELTSSQLGVGNSNDAWKVQRSSAYNNIFKPISFSTTSTYSIYAKKGNYSFLRIAIAGIVEQCYFDLENGTIGTTTNLISSNIEYVNNGWYRCSMTFNNASGTGIYIQPVETNGGIGNSGTGHIFVQYPQVEEGSYATSYIVSNSGSATTRSADVANNSGNADLFNDSEGVLYAEIAALADDGTSRRISLSDASTSNTVEILLQNTGRVDYQVKSGNSFQGGGFFNLTQTQYNKIAVKYKTNDLALWVNGYEVSTDTSANTPIGLSELAFDNGGGGSDFYGKTKELAVFKEALTDAELESLTSWISFTEMATDLEYTVE